MRNFFVLKKQTVYLKKQPKVVFVLELVLTTWGFIYVIKEIAVVNTTQNTSSQSKASASYTIAEDKNGQDGNNITTKSGGDDIFLRIYYETEE